MPWENTEQYIRSGHRNADEFQRNTLRTVTLNAEEGIKAVIGKPQGKHAMEILSYLFEKDKAVSALRRFGSATHRRIGNF